MTLEEMARLVEVRQNGRSEQITLHRALIRGLGADAVNGSIRAKLALLDLYREAEQQRLKDTLSLVESVMRMKQGWAEVVERCRRSGAHLPNPIPHPDDLVIDFATGRIIHNGPADATEKAQWDKAHKTKREAEADIAKLTKLLRQRPEDAAIIEADIASSLSMVKTVERLYPAERIRRQPGFNLEIWRSQDQ